MYYGTIFPSSGDIWRNLQKDWNGNDVERVIDDNLERNFWKEFIRGKVGEGTDQYSDDIMAVVERIIGDNYYDSILEVGPGWGNYTFNMTKHCKQLTCVDISSDILKYIEHEGYNRGIKIKTVNSKWEDYNGKSADVIFAYNCFYRMVDIENCLRKINEKGRSLHIIGMTSGPEQEYFHDFEKELGLKIRYNRLDYIILVNVLYQLGIDCNVVIVPLQKNFVYNSISSAVKKASRRILSEEWSEDDLTRIMKRYMKKGDDGMYHYIHNFKAAIIYW